MSRILDLKNISKTYETKVEKLEILKNINLELDTGDFISIQGKSGSGKTTLLNILGLLDSPTEGEVIYDGVNVDFKKESLKNTLRNEKIGFVFQFHYLLPEFSALENVMLPALVNKSANKETVRKKAEEYLNMVGLGGRLIHKPSELSGGEKQRVAIARAMINDPAVILADEPTGNLDVDTSQTIHDLFFKINKEKGQAIIIVTHSLELAGITKERFEIKKGKLEKL
ncbi:ABC transporter ATP-binding protein [Sebaldella sp. S0638]|uniref:ABC transporter ATP-binding protein n=1 Tax=Sebaldella sp. S0638 TaxID=2957809 RepID=UPI0020A01115|nr:ABC transporter ATP-binding protein [Sebaldella sp. S0638]MCP1224842.1 ABC transporter ATP-binding protein [Sebaldella sp. S0638]